MRTWSRGLAAASAAFASICFLALGCGPDPAETSTTGTGTASGGSGGGGGGGAGADTTSSTSTGDTGTPTPTGPDPEETFPKECDVIYSQNILPTFELEIAQEEWDALYQEWLHGYENEQAGIEHNPQHPLKSFKYENEVVTNAAIRLRGNAIWWLGQNKMQFEISFNEYDKDGRFHGLRNIMFDAASNNYSFLRDRVALSIARDADVLAPCANNTRVMVNGVYYGLFTNLEKVDKSFLKRNFKDNDGNLFKRSGWELKTNEDTPDYTRLDALNAATTFEELSALLDVDQAIWVWATEAVIPNNDGVWAGGLNFYLYDDPVRGKFVILPYDYDSTLTRVQFDADPVTYEKQPETYGRPMYDLALSDPASLALFKERVKIVLEKVYQVPVLQEQIDTWGAQIEKAAEQDINKPFTQSQHIDQILETRDYVEQRAGFLVSWLCFDAGGADIDGDGVCDPQ
jgi:hypothetical protein